MKYLIHPENNQVYLSNQGSDRLKDTKFKELTLQLRSMFQATLKWFSSPGKKDQPVWTYDAPVDVVQEQAERFINQPCVN